MRTLRYLLRKEFLQIFRNPAILKMILIIPAVQLLVLPLAADYEIKNINIAVADRDHSGLSRQLVSRVAASGYFVITASGNSYQEVFDGFEKDKADIILEIPQHFEKDLVRENSAQLLVAANAINGVMATVGTSYLGTIIQDFNADIRKKWSAAEVKMPLQVKPMNWFNPLLNYRFFMVPGILAVLVTMVGSYMCALNIVKEKEVGTIEQVNVTPIRRHIFILGKLIPFWIIGVVIFSIGLFAIAMPVYHIIPAGSLWLVYAFLGIYLIAVLGIGLIISTYANTQQQAMSLAFFCMMLFIMMSGLFTPVDSMPRWAQIIARCNPLTYFIEVMRMVVLKGSTFGDVARHFAIVSGFAVFFNSWAILNYRKSS